MACLRLPCFQRDSLRGLSPGAVHLFPILKSDVLDSPASDAKTQARSIDPPRSLTGVYRLLAFFAFLAILAFGLHIAINHGLRKITTSKFGALNRIVDGRVNAEIVISGSSRALSHYDPRIIES